MKLTKKKLTIILSCIVVIAIIISVYLVSYDKNRKYSNLVGLPIVYINL